jgi:hypothetical protein
LRWIKDIRDSIDGDIEEVENKDKEYNKFCAKYFGNNDKYVNNPIYSLVREE